MKIGILSDTHNDSENIQRTLQVFERYQVSSLLHCGDVTSLASLQWFTEYPLILTFGNGDVATGEMKAYLKGCNNSNEALYQYEWNLNGKRIAATHGHLREINDSILRQQNVDYFFHGHTHEKVDSWVGRTRVINPGAVVRTGNNSSSVCIFDPEMETIVFEEL